MVDRMRIFKDERFGEIWTIFINGDPWIVGKDVYIPFEATNYRRFLGQFA